jgi:hypothetical protein
MGPSLPVFSRQPPSPSSGIRRSPQAGGDNGMGPILSPRSVSLPAVGSWGGRGNARAGAGPTTRRCGRPSRAVKNWTCPIFFLIRHLPFPHLPHAQSPGCGRQSRQPHRPRQRINHRRAGKPRKHGGHWTPGIRSSGSAGVHTRFPSRSRDKKKRRGTYSWGRAPEWPARSSGRRPGASIAGRRSGRAPAAAPPPEHPRTACAQDSWPRFRVPGLRPCEGMTGSHREHAFPKRKAWRPRPCRNRWVHPLRRPTPRRALLLDSPAVLVYYMY